MRGDKSTFIELEKISELLESERKEKQDLFHTLFTNNPTINLLVDKETNTIVDANKAACNFYGYTIEEMVGMNVDQINILSEDEIKREMAKITNNKLYSYNFTHRLKNGETRNIELFSGQIDIENRKLLYSTIIDVTSQKKAEFELSEVKKQAERSDLYFKYVCEQANEGINLADLEGNIVFVNQAYCNMFGYTEDEMLAMRVLDLKIETEPSVFRRTIEEDYTYFSPIKLKRKNKEIIYVDLTTKKIKIENQQLILGVLRDVTERVEKERELQDALGRVRLSEESYRNIYENAIEGMFRTSIEGKSLKVNNSLAQILGYDSSEDAVNDIHDSTNQTWLNASDRQKYAELLNKQQIINGFETQLKRKNGESVWVSINAKLIMDENGEKLYYEGFLEDISDRKSKEFEIQKKMKDLQWHYDIAMERELKMVELKKEINKLLLRLGEEKKYGI